MATPHDADADSSMDGECALCGLPLDARGGRSADGEFCCAGCRQVAEALEDVEGVDEATIQDRQARARDEDIEAASVPDGCDRAFLHVDGMYCTTCEAFMETVAAETDGVESARASYATETVRVDYDPDRVTEADLPDRLTRAGYKAMARDDAMARERAEDDTIWRLGFGFLVGMFVMIPYFVFIYPAHFGLIYPDWMLAQLQGQLDAARYPYYVIWLMTTLVLAVTGAPLFKGAYVSVKTRQPNMTLLVSIAALGAYAYSILAVLLGRVDLYFDVAITIVLVVTAGNYYESTIKREATGLLSDVTSAAVDQATRYRNGTTEPVSVSALEAGDRILVREGERVPVDGTVHDGEATVDEAVITGEPLPESKAASDAVIGGSVVTSGSLVVDVGEGATSSVDRIVEMVWNLQSSRGGVQRLADRLATIFVPAVLVLSTVAGVGYLALGAAPVQALLVALTVLIVSCPCALGLATPLAVASGIREAIEHGIVVFDDGVFEGLREADVVVFDKTGTLTTGEMTVRDSTVGEDLLGMAGALEQRSAHPVANAVVNAASSAGKATAAAAPDGGTAVAADETATPDADPSGEYEIEGFESHQTGVSGTVDGADVLVGHPDLFDDLDWSVSTRLRERADAATDAGSVPVMIGRDGTAEGLLVVGDEPREGWDETLTALGERGVEVVVLTGDESAAVAEFRQHPHVDRVFSGVPPEGKAETVRQLRREGEVTMVGDGTNDAPALAAADLGIAMGGGTALAVDAADVAIVDDDLRAVSTVFEIATATGRRVKQNVGWAFVYNGVAIPLAVLGLLNPLFAALAMATSSLLVVSNSARDLVD
jgi:Cu2+-exporting ATPase